jgi:hypothetical protein
METYTAEKTFIENPDFHQERGNALSAINYNDIDKPIIDIVENFNKLSFCFTLQCCYGHFQYYPQQNPNNFDPLPYYDPDSGSIRYRIAYMAFCLENNSQGKALCKSLAKIPEIDKDYVQFGSADWFWERNKNSFVLQVEPDRFKYKDEALLEWKEAIYIEKIKSLFFEELRTLLSEIEVQNKNKDKI